jgi:MFS transporter, PPP family, 3-phenylpropionic acid transporter
MPPPSGERDAVASAHLLASPGLRVALVFCAIFTATGMLLPFLAPWLQQERGLSGFEVGAIFSAAQLARILVSPPLGTWADGFNDRRTPILIFTVGAFFAYALFFNVQGFWAIFVGSFLATVMMQQIMPLTEAMALRRGQEGPIGYGVLRAIGSGAFILANAAGGAAVAACGLEIVPLWAMCAFVLAVTAAASLARDPRPTIATGMDYPTRLREGGKLLKRPRFVFVVVGAGLIQSAHAYYYVFSAPLWTAQGLSPTVIGLLWGFGVLAEVLLFLSLVRFERRYPPEWFMLLGAAAGLCRWGAMGFAPLGPWVWALQALHAFTFAATHVGAMRIIQREAPEAVSGLAQTLYSALGGGLLLGLSTLASGALYDSAGAHGYWAMAGLAGLGLICILHVARMPR